MNHMEEIETVRSGGNWLMILSNDGLGISNAVFLSSPSTVYVSLD